MQAAVARMSSALDRLSAAVDVVHQETVACRRTLMVFRARMDTAEKRIARLGDALERTVVVLTGAEGRARHAADLFRATAAGLPQHRA